MREILGDWTTADVTFPYDNNYFRICNDNQDDGVDAYKFYSFWDVVGQQLHKHQKLIGTCIETAPSNISHPVGCPNRTRRTRKRTLKHTHTHTHTTTTTINKPQIRNHK